MKYYFLMNYLYWYLSCFLSTYCSFCRSFKISPTQYLFCYTNLSFLHNYWQFSPIIVIKFFLICFCSDFPLYHCHFCHIHYLYEFIITLINLPLLFHCKLYFHSSCNLLRHNFIINYLNQMHVVTPPQMNNSTQNMFILYYVFPPLLVIFRTAT